MPWIDVDRSGKLHVVWTATNRSDNSNEIYYTSNRDTNFLGEEVTRLTHVVNGSRMHPTISIDLENYVHLIWDDQRTDEEQNYDIYYKRTLNPVTEPPIVVTQALNVSICKPGNSIMVSGNAEWNNTPTPNADVSVKIIETDALWTTNTDLNGNYELTITAPSTPGNYTVRVIVTYGNLTGTKYAKLTVESEVVTNGGVTNGGDQGGGRAEGNLNIIYLAIIGAIVGGIIVAFALLKMRRPEVPKVEKTKEERKLDLGVPSKIQTMTLRCPECRMTFSVEVKPKPFGVKCPNCGKEGTIK